MDRQTPTFKESFIIMLFSLIVMVLGTVVFKLQPEILLCILSMIIGIFSTRLGYTWNDLEEIISQKIKEVTPVILMIWTIGMLIGTFIYSGTIPMLIYYGLKLINPSYFIFSAFVVCMVFSVVTGSSWSSAGTVGVALIGAAKGFSIPLEITAGAVVAGSIFGDKLSPLSETTNLAPIGAGVELYDHIKSMMWTTIPPTIIAGIIYLFVGFKVQGIGNSMPEETLNMMNSLSQIYRWGLILLIPFIIVLVGAIKKLPSVPVLFFASISSLLLGVIYQGFSIRTGFIAALNGFNVSDVYGGELAESVLTLLNRGGMKSMIGVILIIFCGYAFAAIISKVGYLDIILRPLINKISNESQLILATLFTTLVLYLSTGSSYIGFIIIPEMLRKKYIDMRVSPMVLSRSLEDVGTLIGPLVPWSVSAAFYSESLGVIQYGKGGYALWTILPYLSPIFAVICAITGIGVYRLNEEEKTIKR